MNKNQMNKEQLLSIIVPVYNGERTIESCLDHIYDSDYKHFEVIVVNDCSTDSTAEKVKKYPCNLINLNKNMGVANARNTGAENSNGKLLIFVDADTYLHKYTLTKLVDSYNKNPNMKIIGIVDSGKYFNVDYSSRFCKLKIIHGLKLKKNENFRVFSSFPSGGCLCEKKVFDEVGGFSIRYKKAGIEEYDFGNRIIENGYRNYISKDITFDHDDHNTLSKRARELMNRTSVYVPLYLQKRSCETNGGTATVTESLLALLSILGILTSPLFFTKLYLIPSIIWTAYLFFNLDFLYYVLKKEGPLYAFYSLFASIYLSTFIGIGIIIGMAKIPFSFVDNLIQLFSSKLPYVDLFVTSKCNLRCKHCFYRANIDNADKSKELTFDELKKISRNFGSIYFLTVTGGEPTLRNDLTEIIRTFYNQNNVKILTLHSNGTNPEKLKQVTKEVLHFCPDMIFILSLSLDGFKEVHEKTRGTKGCYDNVIQSVNLLKPFLKEPNFDMNLNTTLTSYNKGNIEALHKFVQNTLGVKHEIGHLRGKSGEQINDGTLDAYKRTRALVEKKPNQDKGFFLSIKKHLVELGNSIIIDFEENGTYPLPCKALKKSVVISENGDIYACEVLPNSLGNLRSFNYNIKDLMKQKIVKKQLKWIKNKNCKCNWPCIIPVNIVFSLKGNSMLLTKYLSAKFCLTKKTHN